MHLQMMQTENNLSLTILFDLNITLLFEIYTILYTFQRVNLK